MQKRLDYLDIAKGIAIILVVMGHAMLGTPSFFLWFTIAFHLPIFYIVSGILIAHKKEADQTYKTVLIRKCKQILIPYLIFSPAGILYYLAKEFSLNRDNGAYIEILISKLIQTFTLSGVFVLWFLPSLLIGELIFIKILKKTSSKSSFIKTLSFIGIAIFTYLILSNMVPYQEDSYKTLGWGMFILENIRKTFSLSIITVFFTMIGYFIYQCLIIVDSKFNKNISLILFAIVVILSFICCHEFALLNTREDLNHLDIQSAIFFLTNATIGSIFMLCFSKLLSYIPVLKGALAYCGKNSLLIMLTHAGAFPIGFKVENIIHNLIGTYPHEITLAIFTCTVVLVEIIVITIINRYFPFALGCIRKN